MKRLILILTPLLAFLFLAGTPEKKKYKVISSVDTTEGAGARVKRLYRTHILKHWDPFVIMDEFFVEPPAGFPDHPHRGFEAVTYMLDGSFRHKDNLGNDSTLSAGGAQRFTAGRGIIHSEMPGDSGVNHGIQLWINLPKALKKCEPEYQPVGASAIPEITKKGVKVRYVIGNGSPVRLKTEVVFQDITMEPARKHSLSVNSTHQGYIYLIEGQLNVNDEYDLKSGQALLFEPGTTEFKLKATTQSQIIYIAGKPHNEPIRQRGPFVD